MKNKKTGKIKLDKKTQEYLEKFHSGLTWELCFFIVISLLSLCLAYLSVDTLFLTIPFLVLPAFFALITINGSAVFVPDKKSPSIFSSFRMYFTTFFFGGYRIITGFFKSLLAFVISAAGLGTFAGVAILPFNDEYVSFVESIPLDTPTADVVEQYREFALNNEFFGEVATIISIISLFAAAVMFIHQMSKNAVKFFYNLTAKMPLPVPQLNMVHKQVWAKNKKAVRKSYFKMTWFLHLLLIAGMLGGFAINYFAIGNHNISDSFVIGLALGLLLVTPFLNYFTYVLSGVFAQMSSDYLQFFFTTSFDLINKLKSENKINEEQSKEIEKAINDAKEDLKKYKEDIKDKDKKSHD